MTMTPTTRPVSTLAKAATCTLWREDGRCCIVWHTQEPCHWLALFRALRAEFPAHRDAYSRGPGRGWSLPAHHRATLEAWTSAHFPAESITGTLADPAADDEVARLQKRGADLIASIRLAPDHGKLAACLKWAKAENDEQLSAALERLSREHE